MATDVVCTHEAGGAVVIGLAAITGDAACIAADVAGLAVCIYCASSRVCTSFAGVLLAGTAARTVAVLVTEADPIVATCEG